MSQNESSKFTIPNDVTSITLTDGRRLAYAQYGDLSGKPVFHCNGSGGSRLEHPLDETMLRNIGVRFIAVDRPGHGYSDPHPERCLLGFPNDIAALADYLKLERFYVEGWSAGGAYALATAYKLPERVIGCAILSGIGPYERPSPYSGLGGQIKVWMFFARCFTPMLYPFRKMVSNVFETKSAEELGAMVCMGEGVDDKMVAQSPELQAMMGRNFKEGYRQGWGGPVQDDIVINSPWGFQLEDIKTRVNIWQGGVDLNVPRIQGEYQHDRLPNSSIKILEDMAHLFPLVKWREILEQLLLIE